jgi:hypothetical protein
VFEGTSKCKGLSSRAAEMGQGVVEMRARVCCLSDPQAPTTDAAHIVHAGFWGCRGGLACRWGATQAERWLQGGFPGDLRKPERVLSKGLARGESAPEEGP